MLQFHETVRGANFFDHQLPSLINAINRLADIEEQRLALEREKERNKTKEDKNGQ